MTTTLAQTTTAGPVRSTNFGTWGTKGGTHIALPEYIFALIAAFPGAGKSHLVNSNPGTLSINFDGAGTASDAKCQIYGVRDLQNRLIDPSGQAFEWTWERAQALKKSLIEAAKRNDPRPTTIAIDTITSMLRIAKRHFGDNWEAFAEIYDQVAEYPLELRDAGYGVYVLGHFVKRLSRKPGEPADSMGFAEIVPAHPDKLHARLFPHFEMVATIQVNETTEVVQEPVFAEVGGVRKQVASKPVTRRKVERYILADPTEIPGVVKRRAKLPSQVLLPEEGTWDAFRAAYIASNPTLSGAGQ